MIADQAPPERIEPEGGRPKRRLPRGKVHIFDNWCKGCSLCIVFCPSGVLGLGTDNRPKAIYPEKCTACRWCELHCPDFAIFVSELDGNIPATEGATEADAWRTVDAEPAETEPEPETA
jgi:2-oxoglutarate ferredoxin oxidoreductase subunit delta